MIDHQKAFVLPTESGELVTWTRTDKGRYYEYRLRVGKSAVLLTPAEVEAVLRDGREVMERP